MQAAGQVLYMYSNGLSGTEDQVITEMAVRSFRMNLGLSRVQRAVLIADGATFLKQEYRYVYVYNVRCYGSLFVICTNRMQTHTFLQ